MNESYAYLSGLIDGEGCIYLNEEKRNGTIIRTRIRLQITNTNKNLIDKCIEITGKGCISVHQPKQSNWKTRYDWVVYDLSAREILNNCLPYLVSKREQAELALSVPNGIREIPEFRKRMSILNLKGA